MHENHVGAYHGYPVRQNDRNLPLLFGIAYPVCNYDQQRVGQIGNNYLKALFALGFQGFPHNDMRRHLCGFGWQHDCSGQPAQRDFSPLAAYTVILCFSLFKTGALAKSIFNAH